MKDQLGQYIRRGRNISTLKWEDCSAQKRRCSREWRVWCSDSTSCSSSPLLCWVATRSREGPGPGLFWLGRVPKAGVSNRSLPPLSWLLGALLPGQQAACIGIHSECHTNLWPVRCATWSVEAHVSQAYPKQFSAKSSTFSV